MSYEPRTYRDPVFEEIERNFGFDEALLAPTKRPVPAQKTRISVSMNDHEFHRRRAEREIDSALRAADDSIASHHLALARLHHRKTRVSRPRRTTHSAPVFRTDKEA